MAKKPVKYSLVDAFTKSPFKGNPAAVCLLDEERDEKWLQAVAREFNISETCYLTRIAESESPASLVSASSNPRFRLRWFTTVCEVEVPSGKSVIEFKPRFDAILKCPGRGIILAAVAPPDSGFDFYSRFFCPKDGINEDPACGSAHCALAPYWSKKLGKLDFNAYQASSRGGVLNIHLDEQNQRVLLRGKAVTVMEGCILV
ncbi:uncharacterized protein LOC114759210 isoform X3 [Neltuma alba]|uniref:uncharacterized protein LOC114759210 isoform X3 n=1 Tax=Neltuma alba TaxID=207710 RepID=UPI0010A510AB|nr:uncharacterized protein LOC114759210 isoform X3 [Prosopis alba]